MTVVLIGRSAGSFAWTPGEWLSPRELLSNEPVLREANLWEAALVDSYRQSTGTNPGASKTGSTRSSKHGRAMASTPTSLGSTATAERRHPAARGAPRRKAATSATGAGSVMATTRRAPTRRSLTGRRRRERRRALRPHVRRRAARTLRRARRAAGAGRAPRPRPHGDGRRHRRRSAGDLAPERRRAGLQAAWRGPLARRRAGRERRGREARGMEGGGVRVVDVETPGDGGNRPGHGPHPNREGDAVDNAILTPQADSTQDTRPVAVLDEAAAILLPPSQVDALKARGVELCPWCGGTGERLRASDETFPCAQCNSTVV